MLTKSQESKYDFRVNPAYQVDWSHEQSGKKIAATKRRIRFNFGFSSRDAVEKGLSGMDCRGEEHEVVLVWSLTSGKRLVLADGQEIHCSKGKVTENLFETSWTISGGHIIKIVAYAAPPLFPTPGFRQFDLTIDGLSFFDMPKIYELGVQNKNSGAMTSASVASTTRFALPPSERSVPTYKQREISQVSTFSYDAAPAAPVTPDFASAPVQQSFATPPPAPVAQQAPVVSPPAPVQYQQQQQWAPAPAQPVYDEFAPAPPTFEDKSQQILSHYTPAKHMALANTPFYADYDSGTPSTVALTDDESSQDSPDNSPLVLKPTMAPISIAEMQEQDNEPVDEVTRAMKSLVNLDDITFELETPEQAKMARVIETKKVVSGRSKPLPPKAPAWNVGNNASLKDMKDNASPKEQPKKEIMRTHAFDPQAAQAGMMVVYGATPPMGQQMQPQFHAPAPMYAYRAY